MQYKFSFITVVRSNECPAEQLLKNLAPCKGKACQWIVLDRSGDEKTHAALLAAKGDNVQIEKIDTSVTMAEAYKAALSKVQGEWISFSDENVIYDHKLTGALNAALAQQKDAACIGVLARREGSYPFQKKDKKTYWGTPDGMKVLNMYAPSYFYKASLLEGELFNAACEEETGLFTLMHMLQKVDKILFLEGTYCYYREVLSFDSRQYKGCTDRNYYIPSLQDGYLPILQQYTPDNTPKWLQRMAYYNLYFKYYANLNARDKYLVEDEEKDTFFDLTGEVLKYVSDELIMNNMDFEQFVPPLILRNLFMYLKYDRDLDALGRRFFIEQGAVWYEQRGIRYHLDTHQNITIKALTVDGDKLVVNLQYFVGIIDDLYPGCFWAKVNGKEMKPVTNKLYSLDKFFAVPVAHKYTSELRIPLQEVLAEGADIRFYLTLEGETIPLEIRFNRAPSKLNDYIPDNYWPFYNGYIMCYEEKALRVHKVRWDQLLAKERSYVKQVKKYLLDKHELIKFNFEKPQWIKKIVATRKAYYKALDEKKGARIWLYNDKLYKGGDNGEYAFRYAMKVAKEKGIEPYYVLNRDSLDYARMIKEFPDNILVYGSLKCRVYALLAENLVATHPDIIEFYGIDKHLTPYLKNLFNGNLICIAHGVTIQKNADYQNKMFDNTMFYTTSSKYEVEHIKHPSYGYREDEIALTGMARFDGLVNNDQKQILITPTWRRNLVGAAERNTSREYASAFKQTSYYKIYNALINDQRIIESAKKNGYRVIFLLHPSMSAQIDDYDRNDYVELVPATGDMSYEKILTESSLMVTDYSGIHYDFGYMRKPVIYYQPKEVPMRFEEGAMKFKTMGFGPVCEEYEEAVSLICKYMDNQCALPDEFKKHADDFFAFDDHNNSERIFNAIFEWSKKREAARDAVTLK